MTDYLDRLDRVEIGDCEDGTILVTPFWKNVDRPASSAWSLPRTQRRLAERLRNAIESGRFYSDVSPSRDSSGGTFMSTNHPVRGRTMNADLKRMGF